jgi:hypothetical protein
LCLKSAFRSGFSNKEDKLAATGERKLRMKKLIGNLRVRPNPGSESLGPHYEIDFMPYSGKLNTQNVRVKTYDDLVAFLIDLRVKEDEATRWAGQARNSPILIPSVERSEEQLRDSGLLV